MKNSCWWDEAIQLITVVCRKGSKRNILFVISGLTLFQLCVKTPVAVNIKFICLILDWRLYILCKFNSAAAACRQQSANRLTGRSQKQSWNPFSEREPTIFHFPFLFLFKQQKRYYSHTGYYTVMNLSLPLSSVVFVNAVMQQLIFFVT